jgi:hypothetical protein
MKNVAIGREIQRRAARGLRHAERAGSVASRWLSRADTRVRALVATRPTLSLVCALGIGFVAARLITSRAGAAR